MRANDINMLQYELVPVQYQFAVHKLIRGNYIRRMGTNNYLYKKNMKHEVQCIIKR